MEKAVEVKTCKHCNSRFEITDKDLDFYEKVSPVFNLETGLQKERPDSGSKLIKDLWDWKIKYLIPSPTLCPDCRNQRRLSWRNEWNLYKRKCDFSGKTIISMYSPDQKVIVYDKDIWNSDKCDVMKFSMDIDPNKSFFEQFKKLLYQTPIPSLTVDFESENSQYQIYSWKMKNCYMLFASWGCEDTMYSSRMIKTNYVIDSLDWTNLEKCYQIINSENCYWCFYTINWNNCQNCYFSYDLENCSDCTLCYNLVWKKYCIENIEYSKEEYFKKIEEIKKQKVETWWNFINDIMKKCINKNLMMVNCENCVWDNLKSCKSCNKCYHFESAENCKYCENWWMWCYNSHDWRWIWENLQFWYEILDTWINATRNWFLISCYTCNNTFYSINCHNSSELFGCIWLKNKSYCILNKQYSKEEYEKIVPKIIKKMEKDWEWWEFFPSCFSPFWYNETVAEEYFPILVNNKTGLNSSKNIYIDNKWDIINFEWIINTKRPVFKYSSYQSPKPDVEKIIKAEKLPENIKDIPDDILNRAIECEVTKKPFRITSQELEFYRKNDIPIPKKHPTQRYMERVKLTNPKQIFDRQCDKCSKDIKSVFSKDSWKIVYCETCYNKEMY